MCLGVGIPLLIQNTWGWGGALCFLGSVLLFIFCRDWIYGSPPGPLDLGTQSGPEIRTEIVATQSTDQKTFNNLQAVLPSRSIAQLRTQHFSSTFEWNLDRVLLEFHQWDVISEHRFLDPALERIHGCLRDAVDVLVDKVHRYSEQLTEDGRARGFSPLGRIEDMTEFEAHRNEAFEAAKGVCDSYDDLVLTARRKFEPRPV